MYYMDLDVEGLEVRELMYIIYFCKENNIYLNGFIRERLGEQVLKTFMILNNQLQDVMEL